MRTQQGFLSRQNQRRRRSEFYYTALHCSANNDNPAIARLLIKAGANVNAAGIGGITPVQIAMGRKHERVLAEKRVRRTVCKSLRRVIERIIP
jgi:ankyrin repeat protein